LVHQPLDGQGRLVGISSGLAHSCHNSNLPLVRGDLPKKRPPPTRSAAGSHLKIDRRAVQLAESTVSFNSSMAARRLSFTRSCSSTAITLTFMASPTEQISATLPTYSFESSLMWHKPSRPGRISTNAPKS